MAPRCGVTPTILLVDDDADFLEVHSRTLEASGLHVVCAYSQEEAVKVLNRTKLDAAVLDVMMESHDAGFRLARSIRQNPRTALIPIVILSSINEHNRARKLYTFSDMDRDETWLPVDRILDKPCAPARLICVLKELLGAKCRAED